MKKKSPIDKEQTFKDGDMILKNNKKIANRFNKFFVEVGQNLAQTMNGDTPPFSSYSNESFPNSLFLTPISCKEILDIVLSLKKW